MSTKTNPSLKLKLKPGIPPRDKKGRAYYLARLPFYKKYPRFTILTGALICAILPISGPLYHLLFTKPEDVKYQDDWWPSEKASGKRIVDRWRENYLKEQKIKEDKEQLKLAAAAAAKQ